MAEEVVKIIVKMESAQAERQAGGLSRALGGVAGVAGGVLKAGLAAGLAGVLALGAGLGFAISEAGEAQAVLAQTNAVIASTGGIAGVSADELANWATELSLVTKFSDDMVQSAGNMLLTFTNINESIFPQTLALTADLAQAWGTDLSQASIMIGKALNDPIAGLGSLSRVGIQFSEDQKNVIKALVESGDLLGAQSVLLEELTAQVGGSAEAFGQTLPGQIAITKNSIAELAEIIDTGLIDVMSGPLGGAFEFVTGLLAKATKFFEMFFYALGQGFTPLEALQIALGGLIPPGLQGMADAIFTSLTQIAVVVSQPEFQAALKSLGASLATALDQGFVIALNSLAKSFGVFADLIIESGPAIITILKTVAALIELINSSPALSSGLFGGGSSTMLNGLMGASPGTFMNGLAGGVKIPGFADGGTIPRGGAGIVGENEPELAINGPGGLQIIPLSALSGMGGSTTNQYQFYGNMSFNADSSSTLTGLYEQARTAAGFD